MGHFQIRVLGFCCLLGALAAFIAHEGMGSEPGGAPWWLGPTSSALLVLGWVGIRKKAPDLSTMSTRALVRHALRQTVSSSVVVLAVVGGLWALLFWGVFFAPKSERIDSVAGIIVAGVCWLGLSAFIWFILRNVWLSVGPSAERQVKQLCTPGAIAHVSRTRVQAEGVDASSIESLVITFHSGETHTLQCPAEVAEHLVAALERGAAAGDGADAPARTRRPWDALRPERATLIAVAVFAVVASAYHFQVRYLLEGSKAVWAASNGREDILEEALAEKPSRAELAKAACRAANHSRFEIMKRLLEAGVPPDSKEGRCCYLGMVAHRHHVALTRLLLEKGATPGGCNGDPKGALATFVAAPPKTGFVGGTEAEALEVVKLLVSKGLGADDTSPYVHGTALEAARENGHAAIASYLETVAAEAPLNEPDEP